MSFCAESRKSVVQSICASRPTISIILRALSPIEADQRGARFRGKASWFLSEALSCTSRFFVGFGITTAILGLVSWNCELGHFLCQVIWCIGAWVKEFEYTPGHSQLKDVE
jgi:hypothetical protein